MDEQGELEINDKSGLVTRMIWMEYPKAAGWIPGLIYAIAALAFQILRVYTDFWLSELMEESIHSPANVNIFRILMSSRILTKMNVAFTYCLKSIIRKIRFAPELMSIINYFRARTISLSNNLLLLREDLADA